LALIERFCRQLLFDLPTNSHFLSCCRAAYTPSNNSLTHSLTHNSTIMARTKAKPSTSANEDIDEYPDLDFASNEEDDYDTAMRKKVFFEPINTDTTKVSRSVNFTCSPPVVHFSGFQTNEWMEQDIKVINISKHSQRLCVLLPETDFFTVCTTASHTHTYIYSLVSPTVYSYSTITILRFLHLFGFSGNIQQVWGVGSRDVAESDDQVPSSRV
jgi:hypothetical protein